MDYTEKAFEILEHADDIGDVILVSKRHPWVYVLVDGFFAYRKAEKTACYFISAQPMGETEEEQDDNYAKVQQMFLPTTIRYDDLDRAVTHIENLLRQGFA